MEVLPETRYSFTGSMIYHKRDTVKLVHAPDAKAVAAIVPVGRIQFTGERAQVVSERAIIRRSGPVVQAGSSAVVIC